MSALRSVTIEDRVTVPDSAFAHAGYRAWVTSDAYPEGLRTTYVDGEVMVEMSPESIEAHNKVKTELTVVLGRFVREGDLGEMYADGVLVTNEAARLSSEPDLSFASWASFDAGRVRLERRVATNEDYIELVGSPDLVVEIVSNSSVTKDTRRLREAYCRAGVREYWLIDARGAEVTFHVLRNTGEEMLALSDPRSPQTSAVLGGSWELTRARNRAGRFQYTLLRTSE